jgi:hypothetical protein
VLIVTSNDIPDTEVHGDVLELIVRARNYFRFLAGLGVILLIATGTLGLYFGVTGIGPGLRAASGGEPPATGRDRCSARARRHARRDARNKD